MYMYVLKDFFHCSFGDTLRFQQIESHLCDSIYVLKDFMKNLFVLLGFDTVM